MENQEEDTKPIITKDSQTPYNLSQDYLEAFRLLNLKKELVAYVNYELINYTISHDICKVKRFCNYDIMFVSRGIEYGGVYTYNKEDGEEFDLFLKECVRMNALFILPN
jgi:hypothetical protein